MKIRTPLWTISLAASIAVSVLPRVARADHASTSDPYAVEDDDRDQEAHVRTPGGMALSLGGGVSNFTDSRTDAITDPGGNWTARLTIGTRRIVALEAAYLGSVNNIRSLGLDDRAMLLSNGVESDLRLNFTTGIVQPYIFGGAAWRHYSVVNERFNTSDVADADDVLEIPVGGGLAIMYRGFVLDGRFDFRPTFDEELLSGSDTSSGLENWNMTARAGFEF